MKKCALKVVILSILFSGWVTHAALASSSTDAIEKTLSDVYGAPVEIKISNNQCQVNYPAVTIEQEEVEYKPSATDEDELIVETKTVTSTIPASEPTCQRTDDFYGQTQYTIINKTPHKLLAQLYNLSKLAFFKDIEIKDFVEETKIVPAFGLISGEKILFSDATYVEKNPTTGLKSELGNLKKFSSEQKIEQTKDIVKYRIDSDLQDLNLALQMFSIQVASERQAAAFEYKIDPNKTFDWSQGLQNFENLHSLTSRAVGKGIKVNADILNAGISFDVDVKNTLRPTKSGNMDMVSSLLLNHIVFSGDLIEKPKQVRSLSLKYTLQNVEVSHLADLGKLQQSDGDANDAETAKLLDEIVDKLKFRMDFEVQFTDASITGHFDFHRQNDYLHGDGEVYIKNLYGLFPAQKQCINNPQAQEIEACQDTMYLGIQEWVDVSQNDPLNVYKYNEKGLFRNGDKIGDPIEINFQKMRQEQNENDQLAEEDDEDAENENGGEDDDDEDIETMMREINEDTDSFIKNVAEED